MTAGNLFVSWAQKEHSIRVLVMFGSQARKKGENASADEGSDWDFHVITSRPQLFLNGAWIASAGFSAPLVYVARTGRLGKIIKITAVFRNGELDIALLPLARLRLAKALTESRLLRFFPSAKGALSELSTVLRPGYRVLKGSRSWKRFFLQTTTEILPEHLSNRQLCEIADAYVCDYISTRRKIERGELLAAQRWLHWQLAESNFRLLHELRLRSKQLSYPDARRIEMLSCDKWYEGVRVNALCERECLIDAVERSAQTFRELMEVLVDSDWQWPIRS